MKQQKKHTTKQQIALLQTENQRLFSLLIQLSQEVQFIGGMANTTLQVLKQIDGYDKAVEDFKDAEAASESTKQESVTEDAGLILD